MDATDASASVARRLAWLHTVKSYSTHRYPLPTQRYFKLPPSLSNGINADSYKPVMFEFGLWHGSSCFEDSPTLLFKLQALREFCELSPLPSPDDALKDLLKMLTGMHKELRYCYGHSFMTSAGLQLNENTVDKEAAAYAMALDVVTVYIATRSNLKEIGFDPPCIRSIVRRDAVLHDNQLPIFAFRCLLKILHKCRDQDLDDDVVDTHLSQMLKLYAYRNSPFRAGWEYRKPDSDLESLLGCIYDGWMGKRPRSLRDEVENRLIVCIPAPAENNGEHVPNAFYVDVDLVDRFSRSHGSHSSSSDSETGTPQAFTRFRTLRRQHDDHGTPMEYSRSGPPRAPQQSVVTPWPLPLEAITTGDPNASESTCLLSAPHLYRRGIRFKALKHLNKKDPLNLATCITFDDTTITLPTITVVEGTQRILLNLLAYEHTARFSEACTLLSYVCIMDMLINSEEDVELLVEWGVVENRLGSHAHLAAMWNGLTAGYPFRLSPAHEELVKRVRRVSKRRWRRWTHTFQEMYYESRPWLILSAIAALILLLLTLLQTIYAIHK